MKASAGNYSLDNDIETIIHNLEVVNCKGRRVLVTGGAGFLGSWMCEVLVKMGASVVCVDNLSSGQESNIAALLYNSNFTFIKRDVSELFSIDGTIDLIFHMASRASPFEFADFPLEILRANTIGTMNTLEIARQKNAMFLFTSTSETYGNPAIVPTPESYFGNVNSVGIRGCYDESKRCGEAYAMAYKRQYGLDVRIARIFNTYGPKMRADGIYGRVIPRFLSQALTNQPITVFGDGTQTRSFCYVTDQIEGLLKFAFSDTTNGEVINIGNDQEVTIIDLAKKIKSLANSSSEIVFSPLPQDDPVRRRPDINKAKQILGWNQEQS